MFVNENIKDVAVHASKAKKDKLAGKNIEVNTQTYTNALNKLHELGFKKLANRNLTPKDSINKLLDVWDEIMEKLVAAENLFETMAVPIKKQRKIISAVKALNKFIVTETEEDRKNRNLIIEYTKLLDNARTDKKIPFKDSMKDLISLCLTHAKIGTKKNSFFMPNDKRVDFILQYCKDKKTYCL